MFGFYSSPTLTPPLLKVLKRSSKEDAFLSYPYSNLAFLDEFRLLALASLPTLEEHNFGSIMFDTSVPQESSNSWRHFNLTPTCHRYAVSPRTRGSWICTDSDRSPGEGSRDGPLVVDPTQSVIVLQVTLYHDTYGMYSSEELVLVIRATTLIGRMSSARAEPHILWDDWKRDVMVVEVPWGFSHHRTFVLGSRVLLATRDWQDRDGVPVQAYDFSRWGCRALVRLGEGEKERTVMPNPEKFWLQRQYWGEMDMLALGDSLVDCTVSDF